MLDNGLYVRLVAFVINDKDVDITLFKNVKVEPYPHLHSNYKYFVQIDKIEEKIAIIPTTMINKICVNVNVDRNYIIPVPNLLHY
ncbi:hypothetical protein TKK_0016539 [Trichogramma kaykai]